jgi:hypothetical protein
MGCDRSDLAEVQQVGYGTIVLAIADFRMQIVDLRRHRAWSMEYRRQIGLFFVPRPLPYTSSLLADGLFDLGLQIYAFKLFQSKI